MMFDDIEGDFLTPDFRTPDIRTPDLSDFQNLRIPKVVKSGSPESLSLDC